MSTESMENTHYSPAERLDPQQVTDQGTFLLDSDFVTQLFRTIPGVAGILNRNRQVVVSNPDLGSLLGLVLGAPVQGLRLGEVLGCPNVRTGSGGCGTSEACRFCGAGRAIHESMESGETREYECRITSCIGEESTSLDLKVRCSPFAWKDQMFWVLHLTDISDMKRRIALERVFYHDIINAAGGLRGLVSILPKARDMSEVTELHSTLSTVAEGLMETVLEQRELSAAEHGQLNVELRPLDPLTIIQEACDQLVHHEVSRHRTISVDEGLKPVLVKSDGPLLRRVLVNMLKNALEACPRNGRVVIGSAGIRDGYQGVQVQNPGVMSTEVRSQVFQRSFSTKHPSRGLGTYSMKLFGEQYLKGRVEFVSDEEHQTVFTIWLPVADHGLS